MDVPTHGAVFSRDRRHRYVLARHADAPVITWIMLNPSVADEQHADHTLTKCLGFARARGATGVVIVNLYALVSTDRGALRTAHDPVGRANDAWIRRVLAHTRGDVIAAWGGGGFADPSRVDAVLSLVRAARRSLLCLGTTADGSPRHPSRPAYRTPIVPLPLARRSSLTAHDRVATGSS